MEPPSTSFKFNNIKLIKTKDDIKFQQILDGFRFLWCYSKQEFCVFRDFTWFSSFHTYWVGREFEPIARQIFWDSTQAQSLRSPFLPQDFYFFSSFCHKAINFNVQIYNIFQTWRRRTSSNIFSMKNISFIELCNDASVSKTQIS